MAAVSSCLRCAECWPVLGLLLLAIACGPAGDSPAPAAPAPPEPAVAAPSAPAAQPADTAGATAKADEIFSTRCTTCHGPNGEGDGPGSAALNPKPRNFTDPDWQSSVSDEHITNIVLYGGAAVGKSPTMPGNPDLTAQPEVVQALVIHIRGLAP